MIVLYAFYFGIDNDMMLATTVTKLPAVIDQLFVIDFYSEHNMPIRLFALNFAMSFRLQSIFCYASQGYDRSATNLGPAVYDSYM